MLRQPEKNKRTNGKRIFSMVDITHKSNSLRTAIAAAVINVSKEETVDAVRNKTVPKGDVFEFSRAAGLLARDVFR